MRRLTRPVLAAMLLASLILSLAPQKVEAATRTLRFAMPSVQQQSSQGREVVLGPGAARRLAGVVTQSEPALVYGDPVVDYLTSALVVQNPSGCGAPISVSFTADSFYVKWSSDCVNPGEFVLIRFTSPDSASGCGTAKWKDASDGNVVDAICSPGIGLPGFDRRSMVGLTMLMAVGALVAMRRRWVLVRTRG